MGAIKLRVQERGGEVVKVSPLELAKRFRQEELLRQDEKKFFRDNPFIKGTAAKVIDELMKELMAQVEHIQAEVGSQWMWGYESEGAGVRGVLRYGGWLWKCGGGRFIRM